MLIRGISRMIMFLCGVMLIVSVFPLRTHAQEEAVFIRDVRLASNNAKYPQLAVDSRGVYISAVDDISTTSDGNAKLWIKTSFEEENDFPMPLVVGTATRGISQDHVQTSVATSPYGELYVMWIDQVAKTILVRRREADGVTWTPPLGSPPFTVMRGHLFAAEPAIAVRTNGQIVAAWRDARVGRVFYTYSDNRGQTWSSPAFFSVPAYKMQQTAMAAGPNGELAILFVRDSPRPIHVMAALWNGTAFGNPVDINAHPSQNTDERGFGDASVAFSPDPAPNTRIVIGYRHAEEGIFFTEKLVSEFNTLWIPQLLASGKGDSRVSVDYDQARNLHVSWIRSLSPTSRTTNQIHHTVRPANRSSFAPITSSSNIGRVFSAFGKARVTSASYMHVAYEYFEGDQPPKLGYALFRGPRVFGSRPLIENDARMIGGDGKTSISVTFPQIDPSNPPTHVRWRWEAQLTDSEDDSSGWQMFNPTGPTSVLTVPIPDRLRTDIGCVDRTLYTQIRNANVSDTVRSDNVIIDLGVAASISIANPFSSMISSPFTSLGDLVTGGASGGHPDYTRMPSVYLEVRDLGDCSGLRSVSMNFGSASPTSFSNFSINDNRFANVLSFAVSSNGAEGPFPVIVTVRDRMDNSLTISRTMYYDATPPILINGSLEARSISNDATILVNLEFVELSVTDNLYPGRGFWGVWIANSREPVDDPINDPELVWTPVPVFGDSNSFTLTWSVVTGLPETQRTPGIYYIYARVLDGAGNPSAAALPVTVVVIDELTYPTVRVPLIAR